MRTEAEIYRDAHEAGMNAANECTPEPMVVRYQGADGQMQRDVIYDGVCGFAWIRMPARGKFVKFLKMNEIGRKSFTESGWRINVDLFNQSMQKKEAYASAFAKVLRTNNIDAYSESRMD